MKRKHLLLKSVISAAVIAAALLLIRYFSLDRINFVVSRYDEYLYSSLPERGILAPYRCTVSVYPEKLDDADAAIYSPSAALFLIRDGASSGVRSACFGISDAEASDYFDVVFSDDIQAQWNLAYENAGMDALLPALIYDESDYEESELASLAPESVPSFAYAETLSRVAAEKLSSDLAANGVQTLIIYDPSKTSELLQLDDGCTYIVDSIYQKAFESGQRADTVGYDFTQMTRFLLDEETEGIITAPYMYSEFKNSFEVFLDNLI